MDTVKIRAFLNLESNLDEVTIQQRMRELKRAFNNSVDTSMPTPNEAELRELVISAAKKMGGEYLLGQDNAIIATAFAQFALEGSINTDLKALTIIAIKRQLLPLLIDRYDNDYRSIRKQQLTKMLEVINKAPLAN